MTRELNCAMTEKFSKQALKEVLTAAEAAKIYGVNPQTIKDACRGVRKWKKFNDDEYRQCSSGWFVTRSGMDRLFGEKKVKK